MENLDPRKSFPALRCIMGDWVYYVTYMKFSDVNHWIKPTDQIHHSKQLRDMIQRELKPRANDIADYLVKERERFFNSIVVGLYGGDPQWYPITISDSPVLGLPLLDEDSRQSIGILMLEGSEDLFAIDGQHRVQAIKEAITRDATLGYEDISVIFVAHQKTAEGQRRTRRLFTTLNKWARAVSKGEIISLDEDDAFAVTTRRLVEEFPLLMSESRKETRFIHFGPQPSLNPKDRRTLTTIRSVYEIANIIYVPILRRGSPDSNRPSTKELKIRRPSNERLDDIYQESTNYWSLLVRIIPEYSSLFNSKPEDELAGRFRFEEKHFMFRPIGQQVFARAVRIMMDRQFSMEEAIATLAQAPLRLDQPPWRDVVWDSHTDQIRKGVTQLFIEGILLYMVGQPPRRRSDLLGQYREYLKDEHAVLPDPVTGVLL